MGDLSMLYIKVWLFRVLKTISESKFLDHSALTSALLAVSKFWGQLGLFGHVLYENMDLSKYWFSGV